MPPAPPVLPIPVPDTALMESFLAAELLAWLVYRKRHGKRFSAFKMAEEIVLRVDRPKDIDPDTVRRMLRCDVVQHPLPETLSAVAAYLVDQGRLCEADLRDVAGADVSHWAGRQPPEQTAAWDRRRGVSLASERCWRHTSWQDNVLLAGTRNLHPSCFG